MSKPFALFPLRMMSERSKDIKINLLKSIAIVFFGAAILFSAWFMVQNTIKSQLVQKFEEAVALGKIHVFIQQTDWQTVRKGMKDDLKRRALHNVSLPQQAVIVDELVEYYVRPDNVPELLRYYHNKASHVKPRDFIRNIYFTGLTEVTIELAIPPQPDKPWLNQQEPARAVFRLIGTQWLLKKLDAPDYLIPTQVPARVIPILQNRMQTDSPHTG